MSPTPSETYPRLLGDIGGTNARFALQLAPGASMSEPRTLLCAEYESLRAAVERFLAESGAPRPRWGAFGLATPIAGDEVRMTNLPWSFSIRALERELGLERLVVINDFAALALSLPTLGEKELMQVGGGAVNARAPLALLGPGTGLGVSALVPRRDGGYELVCGEGGHMTLGAFDEREAQIISWFRRHYGHVSAERVLCGRGLADLYAACCERATVSARPLAAGEVTAIGILGADAQCREAVETFCAMLGTVAADLALILGAFGGVYIGGGIVPRFGEYFRESPFRARFESKGRFSDYLARIPAFVIKAEYPALRGAAIALQREARIIAV